MSEVGATARTYNQAHLPRKYTPGKRRVSIYWTWSYPWEANRDVTELDNRFSTMVSLACCCSPLEQPTTRTAAQQEKTRWRTLASAVKGIYPHHFLSKTDADCQGSLPPPCKGIMRVKRLLSVGVEGS